MNEERTIKDKINNVVFKFIDNDKDKEDINCKRIIEILYKDQYINKYTLDIVSLIIEYIKDNLYNKYLYIIFKKLEDNNILTTLLQIQKNEHKKIAKNLVEEIIIKFLDEMTTEIDELKCKFKYNYNIPGFYNFYLKISDYINKNITLNYIKNEKNLRKMLDEDIGEIRKFHENEENLLNNLSKEIENNYKFIFNITNKIPEDLLLKDYITFYVQKYKENHNFYDDINYKDDIYYKLLDLLLKLRFNNENQIITNNSKINIFLIKIIWIESNINYIFNILKIIENAKQIFNDEGNKLYKKIEEESKEIKYITKERRNPKLTKEVNECFYKLLASVCYSIASDEIKLVEIKDKDIKDEIQIEISYYYFKLIEINKTLQILNEDLYIYLNEMYIIDELIKIIEIFKNKNIKKIDEAKKNMVENCRILQEYADNFDSDECIEKLSQKFDQLYNLIDNIKYKKDKDYYDNLRYILFKEFKKINETNYRNLITVKLLEENEMIKNSIDFFQLIFKKHLNLKLDKFKSNIKSILEDEENIIMKYIENKLSNNILEETIFYLFEKNSLVFLKNTLKNEEKENIEDTLLKILEECIKFLESYISEDKKNEKKLKELCKLFCLSYIKTYCYTFTNMHNNSESKFKNPEKVINIIKEKKPIYKMMRIFIYRILFNNYNIDVFKNSKFKLEDYGDIGELIKIEELNNINKIDYKIKTLKDKNYDNMHTLIEKNIKEEFKKVRPKDFNIKENGVDNFYVASYNSTLSKLLFEKQEIDENFYTKICKSVFDKDLLKAINLFYEPEKYYKIQNEFSIDSNNIKPLLFGYRFCLNELFYQNNQDIYYPLYTNNYNKYMKERFYPGNDSRINLVYSDIIKHFENKSNEGCYVKKKKKWYYHSIPSGFPGENELDMKCPECSQDIGSYKKVDGNITIVKNQNYFRIFKDNDEIEEMKNSSKRGKMREINYMTLEEFEEKYINKSLENEIGIYNTDKDDFKKDKKVRKLSPVTFRLLNYILNIHLFFVRLLLTDKKEKDFDKNYLPKGMTWVERINECWNLLNNELLKENIDSIEDFIHYIFVDLFNMLNKSEYIENYEKLLDFEEELEEKIKEKIDEYKHDISEIKRSDDNINSFIYLLKEKYPSEKYDKKEFPFYKYFNYVYYLDEQYIKKKLEFMDANKFSVLSKYLKKQNKDNDNSKQYIYKLKDLNKFNNTLNLISERYFNNISRDLAEKTVFEKTDIYKKNKNSIDKFIKFYNDLKLKDIKGTDLQLSKTNNIKDFFIDSNNKYGKTYINIYKDFAKQQNEEIDDLLDIKINQGIFDKNCKNKVNIQQINENEIFTLELPEDNSLIDILFNSSHRKILDSENLNHKLYKEYEINYDYIEEKLTDLLLKNKKILNDNIIEFIYNNETFNNKLTNFITEIKRYCFTDINDDDKVAIYKFCTDNPNNKNMYKCIIQDFKSFIKFLNDNYKEKAIMEEEKIYEVITKFKENIDISENFIELFKPNDSLKVGKIYEIFQYFLKVVYNDISDDIKIYNEDVSEESRDKIENYYKVNRLLSKQDLAFAIRLFMSLVLFPEEDKENKIKKNNNNVINYFKAPDLWPKDKYINSDFDGILNDFKLFNVKICQIVYLYKTLGKDINDNEFDNIKKMIKDIGGNDDAEEEEKEKTESGDDSGRED